MEHELGHGVFQALTQRLPHQFAVRLLIVLGFGAFSLWARTTFPRLANRASAAAEATSTPKKILVGLLNLLLTLGLSAWVHHSTHWQGGRLLSLIFLAFGSVLLALGVVQVLPDLGRRVLQASTEESLWSDSILVTTVVGTLILGFLANVPLLGWLILTLSICEAFGVGWFALVGIKKRGDG